VNEHPDPSAPRDALAAARVAAPPVADATAAGAEPASIHIEANGLRFRVLECLPPGLGGGAPPDRLALCLHGFPECAHSWAHQLPFLAARGYRAWAPDLRGYGGSERPTREQDYAIEKLVADVAGLLEAAGARETVLLAHDWGGIIAWYFAMRHPGAIDRLVILNAPHPAVFREQMHLRQALRSWYGLAFQVPGLAEALIRLGPGGRSGRWVVDALRKSSRHPENFDDARLQPFVENASSPGALKAMLAYYRALLRGGGARRQAARGLPRIETPTLMIWGVDDVALTRRTSYGTVDHVPDLVQRYLPDTSHWVQQDQPELVETMIGEWLEGRPVPHAPGATADVG